MTYASTDDVAVSLGRDLTSPEEDRAGALLERVELTIKRRISDLATRITTDADLEGVVVRVEADAVARVLSNPNGVYQEQIDDYSYTRDRAVSAGTLYVSADEWDDLLSTPGTSVASEAFTIRPFGEPGFSTTPDERVWVTPTDLVP